MLLPITASFRWSLLFFGELPAIHSPGLDEKVTVLPSVFWFVSFHSKFTEIWTEV